MKSLVFALVPLVLGAGFQAAAKDAPSDDLKKIKGLWIAQSLHFGGDQIPEEVTKRLKLNVKDHNATMIGGLAQLGGMYVATARTMEFKVVLGIKDGHKTIDLVENKEGGRTIPGLYKIEKGKLTMCLNFKDGERPESLESKEGTGIGLYVFEQPAKE